MAAPRITKVKQLYGNIIMWEDSVYTPCVDGLDAMLVNTTLQAHIDSFGDYFIKKFNNGEYITYCGIIWRRVSFTYGPNVAYGNVNHGRAVTVAADTNQPGQANQGNQGNQFAQQPLANQANQGNQGNQFAQQPPINAFEVADVNQQPQAGQANQAPVLGPAIMPEAVVANQRVQANLPVATTIDVNRRAQPQPNQPPTIDHPLKDEVKHEDVGYPKPNPKIALATTRIDVITRCPIEKVIRFPKNAIHIIARGEFIVDLDRYHPCDIDGTRVIFANTDATGNTVLSGGIAKIDFSDVYDSIENDYIDVLAHNVCSYVNGKRYIPYYIAAKN